MKRCWLFVLAVLAITPGLCRGQIGGNITYSDSGGRNRAEQVERSQRNLSDNELPPNGTSTFVEASVLMNIKADEYVAVFGIARVGESVADAGRKMEATVRELSDAFKVLGVGGDDVFVDFVAQYPVYNLEVKGDIAYEKRAGFELKKNLVVHYKDRLLLDKLIAAAARADVFDLIKVDYLVNDPERVRDRLIEEAARVIKRKTARYETLLGLKLQNAPAQVYAERTAIHYPPQMYESYRAFEAEEMSGAHDRRNYTVQTVRKTRTSFFNGLDASGFDQVINPVVIEPVVQFTLYLKVKYELNRPAAR